MDNLRQWLIICAVITGCNTVPPSIVKEPLSTRPLSRMDVPPTDGAIFQLSSYRPLLEDRRARVIGDTLTILINENTSAGKSADSSVSKTGNIAVAQPAIGGKTIKALSASGKSDNKFAEKGAINSHNNFSGSIGVTVAEVLPNGNLVVSGEKQIAFDKGIEYVRFSGIVDPDHIMSGNTVSSTLVANAKVEYRTNTHVDMAEFMSSLSRFFYSLSPF